jgi:hypothetical protein
MFDPFLSDYRPHNSRVSGAVFGEVAGQKSLADVQDLLTSVRYRMQQMAAALGQVNPALVKDPTAFAALMVDAGNLKTRVSRADANASLYLSAPNALPATYSPAQGAYDGLLKAIRQNAPPDGAPLKRGDYDDVINRIKQIGGVSVDLSQMPQPRAKDPDRTFLQNVPQVPAIQKPVELDWLEDIYRFVKEYEKEILVVSLVAGGVLLWHMAPHVIPMVGKAAKAAILL